MTAAAAIHASAVALDGRGLLILGPAGAGKSALALELIALGAGLIADDLVRLAEVDGALTAAPVDDGATGLIEARGIGLLRLSTAGAAPVRLVMDLGRPETERLPPRRRWRRAPLLLRPSPLSPAALLLALKAGGPEDPEAEIGRLLRGRAGRPKVPGNGSESTESG